MMVPFVFAAALVQPSQPQWLEFQGGKGPGMGKRVVLLAGDEEYRSEESLPQLARILAKHHGFTCTVLFSLNERGEIDPTCQTNQPGTHLIAKADLVIMALRFRRWPDEQMKPFVDYVESGKPIIGLRTSTHAFAYPQDSNQAYAATSWDRRSGFGMQVLGETWVSHWGKHGAQGTHGVAETGANSPILNSVTDVWGETDVYEVHPPKDAKILMRGEVVDGLTEGSQPATGRKSTATRKVQGINDPMMPIVWSRELKGQRILTYTMGSARDFLNEGLRRLLVNGAYWSVGMTPPKKAEVGLVGSYQPSEFGFGKFRPGIKPSDLGKF